MNLSIKRIPSLQMFSEVACHNCWDTKPALADLWWFPERTSLAMGRYDLYVSQFCPACTRLLTTHVTHFTCATHAAAHLIAARLLGEADDCK